LVQDSKWPALRKRGAGFFVGQWDRAADVLNVGNAWVSDVDSSQRYQHDFLMFETQASARADMTAGTLYAITGDGGWIYYGQVTPEKMIGFFKARDRELASPPAILTQPVMSVVSVVYPSIGRALRSGKWKKLGRFPVVPALNEPRPTVQWPLATLTVTVWTDGAPNYDTQADDLSIQDLELIAAWDAEYHIPERLTADFGVEPVQWYVGGPIHRERRVREERARRSPDHPSHKLPAGWVSTSVH
jgi:hypothetical protein